MINYITLNGISRLVCCSAGFRAAQSSALDALSEVLVCYRQALGAAVAAAANSAGQTECNLLDVATEVTKLCRRASGCPSEWDHRAGWAAACARSSGSWRGLRRSPLPR